MTKTSDTAPSVRFPAEWESAGAVLLAWPHAATDWAYMLPEVERCYHGLVQAITRHAAAIVIAPDTTRAREILSDIRSDFPVFYFDVPTDDTWTRDYGVITTVRPSGQPVLNDFGFNAWGGKFPHEHDNAVTRAMYAAGLIRGEYADRNSFILEGGSIESDGRGTLMVTSDCLLTPTRNPGLGKAEIEAELARALGARKVIWATGAIIGDDTDGHIDTLARLAPGNIIFYATPAYGADDPEQTRALRRLEESLTGCTDAEGNPFSMIGIPLPATVSDPEDGSRLPATYLNYLVINDAVLMPSYGQPMADRLASQIIRIAFPDHTVETVDCRALIRQHGSLHCATMQLPQSVLPI